MINMVSEDLIRVDKVLSIAISAYNKESYLDRCVQSLLISSLDKIEIIIVNDGSSDKTSEIAHKYERQYPRSVIVIDKENGHQGSCINAGLRVSRGKYFKTLDADDYFDSNVLENIIRILENSDADMVVAGHVISGEMPLQILPKGVIDMKIYNLKDINFIKMNNEECLGMHGTLYKSSIFKDNNIVLSENAPSADTEYCYYPIRYCSTIQFIMQNLYIYQTGVEGQESSLMTLTQKDGCYLVAKRMIDDYISNVCDGNMRDNLRVAMNKIIISYLGRYVLYYFNNKEDDRRAKEIFSIIEKDEVWLSEILRISQYKVRFLEFYYKYGICTHPVTSIFAFIKRMCNFINR